MFSGFSIRLYTNLFPANKKKLEELAEDLNISMAELAKRADSLHESNPMMGAPRRAIGRHLPRNKRDANTRHFEAAAGLIKKNKKPYPEIMIPVVCDEKELENQLALIKKSIRKF